MELFCSCYNIKNSKSLFAGFIFIIICVISYSLVEVSKENTLVCPKHVMDYSAMDTDKFFKAPNINVSARTFFAAYVSLCEKMKNPQKHMKEMKSDEVLTKEMCPCSPQHLCRYTFVFIVYSKIQCHVGIIL